jgi:hypothetical protein
MEPFPWIPKEERTDAVTERIKSCPHDTMARRN